MRSMVQNYYFMADWTDRCDQTRAEYVSDFLHTHNWSALLLQKSETKYH